MKSNILFFIAIIVCAWAILWKIADFPIYFFCDEASFGIVAYEWIQNGWRDLKGTFLPIYYEIDGGRNTPMFSSYLQAISASLLGFSAQIARTTNAILSLLGVIAVSFAARNYFARRVWWLVPVLFSSIPIWFLHSRTAFDNIVSVAFLGCTLLFYCQYRLKSANYIFAVVIAASAFFYTYASSQIVLPLIALALIVIDFKYHWTHKRIVMCAMFMAVIFAIPTIRFNLLSSVDGFGGQMRALDSYLVKAIPLQEKIFKFSKEYISAFNPNFWLSADSAELIRHRIRGHGHFPQMFVPFLLIGLLITLYNIRKPAFRTLLVCALIIPIPGALCEQSISRILTLTVPFILWTAIGFDYIIKSLRFGAAISILAFIGLLISTISMATDSVKNGGLWYEDYTLYGLQFGTRHLFEQEIPKLLEDYPDAIVKVSPNFANNPASLVHFFFSPDKWNQVLIGSMNLIYRTTIGKNDVYVVPSDEYDVIIKTGKFKPPQVLRTLALPNGKTGFYFLKLEYVDNIDEIFEAERQRRMELETEEVEINTEKAIVKHSKLDMGRAKDIFDGDLTTLARGFEANPFTVEVEFEKPKNLSEIGVYLGNTNAEFTVSLFSPDEVVNKIMAHIDGRGHTTPQPIYLQDNLLTKKARILIHNIEAPAVDHVHIFDMRFKFAEAK